MVEHVNSNLVGTSPTPHDARLRTAFLAVVKDIMDKNVSERGWMVDGILYDKVDYGGQRWLKVDWTGDYVSTWVPRTNVPEEIIPRYLAKQPKAEQR